MEFKQGAEMTHWAFPSPLGIPVRLRGMNAVDRCRALNADPRLWRRDDHNALCSIIAYNGLIVITRLW
jgi:hypothetical protein